MSIEVESIARHVIDERIRSRRRLASPGRDRVRRRTAMALRHLAEALSPEAGSGRPGSRDPYVALPY